MFFPPSTPETPEDRIEREMRAKSFCKACQVVNECLDYALVRGEDFGIWGGFNEHERKVLRVKSS